MYFRLFIILKAGWNQSITVHDVLERDKCRFNENYTNNNYE